jgi:hypothetical protein
MNTISDEDAAQQIMRVFHHNGVRPGGRLRRNNFQEVRDAHFQRGLDTAIKHGWLKIVPPDRYTYELTEAGFAAVRSRTVSAQQTASAG